MFTKPPYDIMSDAGVVEKGDNQPNADCINVCGVVIGMNCVVGGFIDVGRIVIVFMVVGRIVLVFLVVGLDVVLSMEVGFTVITEVGPTEVDVELFKRVVAF